MQQWSRAASRSQSRSIQPIHSQKASSHNQKPPHKLSKKDSYTIPSDPNELSEPPQKNRSKSPSTTIDTQLPMSNSSHIALSFQKQEAQWKQEKTRLHAEIARLKEQMDEALLTQQKTKRMTIEVQIYKKRVNVLEQSNAKEMQRRRELEEILDELQVTIRRVGLAMKKREQTFQEERNAMHALVRKQSAQVQSLELELENERMARMKDKEMFATRLTGQMHPIQERIVERVVPMEPTQLISIELPERMHMMLEDWKQQMEKVIDRKISSYDSVKPEMNADLVSHVRDEKVLKENGMQRATCDKKIVDKCTSTEPEILASDAKEDIVNVALLNAYFLENANRYQEESTLLSDLTDAEPNLCEESKEENLEYNAAHRHGRKSTPIRWNNPLNESVQHVVDSEDALLCQDIQKFYDVVRTNIATNDACTALWT